LHLRAAGVRRLDHAEETGSLTAAGREKRVDGIAAEVWVYRHRVGERLPPVRSLEKGAGVRSGGRTDVATLRVGDHLQAGRPRVGADVLERTHAVGAEGLEERDLWLHAHDVRRHRVHESTTEACAGIGRFRTA